MRNGAAPGALGAFEAILRGFFAPGPENYGIV